MTDFGRGMAFVTVADRATFRYSMHETSLRAQSNAALGPNCSAWRFVMDTVSRARERGLVVLRVVLGFGFLFAGLEKVLELGGTGPFSAAGFLARATAGSVPNMVGHVAATMVHNPTRQLWVDLAANTTAVGIINFLVVFGEVAIGAALILGVATRLSGVLGALMMFLFWIANWSFANGFINEQFVYGLLAAVVAYGSAGRTFGLDAILEKTEFVRRTPALRFVLG